MDGQRSSTGSHENTFFDLLLPSVSASPSTSPSIVRSSSSHAMTGSKKDDNPFSDFNFSQDDVLPNYDFHPVRNSGGRDNSSRTASSMPYQESMVKGNKSRQSSPPRPSYASVDPPVYRTREPPITYESSIQNHDQLKDSLEAATVAAVERTMQKYGDHLLHVLEGMSGRLLQLENSTQRLEHSVQILKSDAANNYGDSDGKLRMLENLIKEVERGVQILRDKQEISEAHSQLVKLQLVKNEAPASTAFVAAPVEVPTKLLGPQQSELPVRESHVASQQPPSIALQQAPTMAPQTPVVLQQSPVAPQALSSFPQVPAALQASADVRQQQQQQQQQQQLPALPAPPVAQNQLSQLTAQQPQAIVYSNSSHVSLPAAAPSQPYAPQPHPHPQQQSSQSLQMQPYNQPPHVQQQYTHQHGGHTFSNIAQASQPQGNPPQAQGSQGQRTQVPAVYHASQPPYPPKVTQGPPPQLQSYQIPPQQHGASVQPAFGPSFGRSNSGQLTLPGPYTPQAQPLQGPPMYEAQAPFPSSAYNNPNYHVAQPLLSAPGGGGYPKLPLAQPIQHSLPHAPADDVVERVAAMGFSRDQVRAVVRRLSESGQPADPNVVLDKLTNGGEDAQPQRGWFGR